MAAELRIDIAELVALLNLLSYTYLSLSTCLPMDLNLIENI